MKYQNKGDDDWQLTSNNYACWHNTVVSFLFYCSYHAPFLEVQVRHRLGGPGQRDRTGQIMHVCPPPCLCAYRCASSTFFLNVCVHSCLMR